MEDKSQFTDSAGVPWSGRSFTDNQFKNDDGSADSNLLSALIGFRDGSSSATEIVEAFAVARILVPLVANLAEEGQTENGLKTDKSAELSIVTVLCPDGQTGLPLFSSVEAMKNWNSEARPVPNFGRAAALAAASEGTTRIVLDPTASTEYVFRRPAIAAIAQGLTWLSPEKNLEVENIVKSCLSENSWVDSFDLSNADPEARLVGQELLITLYLDRGLSESGLAALENDFFARLTDSQRFVELVDSVAVRFQPAN